MFGGCQKICAFVPPVFRCVWAWFAAPQNQFGIKLALAGGLALYFSELLALSTPVWSVTTVVVLMLPMYLGAVAEKSLFRAVGTVMGGFAAVLLVGNLVGDFFLFQLSAGVILFVCIYFYGGTRAPYAFFLGGMTMLIVMTRGMSEPQKVVFIAFDRVEEILLGIFCSVVVAAVLWPRYARREFLVLSRSVFSELAGLEREVFGGGATKDFLAQWETKNLRNGLKMRDLIKFGARESPYFRAHVDSYTEMVGTQGMLAQNFSDLASVQLMHPFFSAFLKGEGRSFGEALRVALETLGKESGAEGWAEARRRLREEWEVVSARLIEGLQGKMEGKTGVLRLMPLSIAYAMLEETVLLVEKSAELFFSFPSEVSFQKKKEKKSGEGKIGVFWVKNGVRGALCSLSALVFCNWFQPPGETLIPVYALVFSVVSRSYIGGRGDIGVFRDWVRTGVWGIPWATVVFLISPALTNYLWMNLFLGGSLFLLGRVLFAGAPGMTYLGNLLINSVVASLSLNFQEAVTFYDVASCYIGTMIGLGFAAVFQRLLWPVLPQREFRDSLISCLGKSGDLLKDTGAGKSLDLIRHEVILLAGEVQKWSSVLLPPDFPAREEGLRQEAVRKMERFAKTAWKTKTLFSQFALVQEVEQVLGSSLAGLRREVAVECERVADSLRGGRWQVDAERCCNLGKDLLETLRGLPYEEIWKKYPSEVVARCLALVAVHRFLAIRFHEMAVPLGEMDWEVYEQDRVL